MRSVSTITVTCMPPKCPFGILLAGGRSTRMGRDKALLNWHGQTLLDHQLQTLQKICKQTYVSGMRPGYNCIPDLEIGRGPVEGLRSALHFLKEGTELLVMPLDMPLLKSATLQALLIPSTKSVVRFSSYEMPFLIRDPQSVLTAIETSVRTGRGLALRQLFRQLTVHEVTPPCELEFLNANTTETWNEALCATNDSAPGWR